MTEHVLRVLRAAFAALLAAVAGAKGHAEPICPFDATMARDGRFVMGVYDYDLAFIWDLDLLGNRLAAAQVHKFDVKGVDPGATIVFAPDGRRLAYKFDRDGLQGDANMPLSMPAPPAGGDADPDQIVACEMEPGFPCTPVFDLGSEMSVTWLEWSPEADRLIFITTEPTRLRTIRFAEEGAVSDRSSIRWGAGIPVIDWARDRLAVLDYGRLKILDLETLEREKIVPTLKTSTPLAFTEDGDHLVVRTAGELRVHYIGRNGLAGVTQIRERIIDRDVHVGPDGALWYLQSFDSAPGAGSQWGLSRAQKNGGAEQSKTLYIRTGEHGARFLGISRDNAHAVISVSNDCSHEFRLISLKDGQTRFNLFPGDRTYWKRSFGLPHLGPRIGWEAGYRTTPLPTQHLSGLLGYAELAAELGERSDLAWFAILELIGPGSAATGISDRLTRMAAHSIDVRMAGNILRSGRPAEAIEALNQVIPQISALRIRDEGAGSSERLHRAADGNLSALEADARLIRAEAAIALGDKNLAAADIDAVLAANQLDWRAHAGRLRLNFDASDVEFSKLLEDSQETLRTGNWTVKPDYGVPHRFFDEDALRDARREALH